MKFHFQLGPKLQGLGPGTSQALSSKQECTYMSTYFLNQTNRNKKKKRKEKVKYTCTFPGIRQSKQSSVIPILVQNI